MSVLAAELQSCRPLTAVCSAGYQSSVCCDELCTVTQVTDMTSSPPLSSPPPPAPQSQASLKDPVQSVTETLSAVANMKRLLEAYRSLAPLTIGGPSSTSLETQGHPQVPGRIPSDPRFIKKFAPYPFLMGPVFPPAGLQSGAIPAAQSMLLNKVATSDNSRASPAPPIFSPRDKESSRLRLCDTVTSLTPSD